MADLTIFQQGGGVPIRAKDQGDGTFDPLIGLSDGSGGQVDLKASNVRRLASAGASQNPTNVKAAAGTVDGVKARNGATYAVLVRLYDKAAVPVPGVDTVLDALEFPAGQIAAYDFPAGLKCTAGIGFDIVRADNGGAITGTDITNFALYWR